MPKVHNKREFQSRNRESFLFKPKNLGQQTHIANIEFQSRNRESFLFKKWVDG